ncbi:MAG TPA: hypothetical protein VE033_04655 [Acetobacteraceae bacterium]|nr:hypothetical protein [Acetobacteraceae bacterium]
MFRLALVGCCAAVGAGLLLPEHDPSAGASALPGPLAVLVTDNASPTNLAAAFHAPLAAAGFTVRIERARPANLADLIQDVLAEAGRAPMPTVLIGLGGPAGAAVLAADGRDLAGRVAVEPDCGDPPGAGPAMAVAGATHASCRTVAAPQVIRVALPRPVLHHQVEAHALGMVTMLGDVATRHAVAVHAAGWLGRQAGQAPAPAELITARRD